MFIKYQKKNDKIFVSIQYLRRHTKISHYIIYRGSETKGWAVAKHSFSFAIFCVFSLYKNMQLILQLFVHLEFLTVLRLILSVDISFVIVWPLIKTLYDQLKSNLLKYIHNSVWQTKAYVMMLICQVKTK